MSFLLYVIVAAGSEEGISDLIDCFRLGSLDERKLAKALRYLRLNVGVHTEAT